MKLPDNLLFRNVRHGSGVNGMYVYHYSDTAGAGVHLEARRASRGAEEVRTWRHTALPNQGFTSLEALEAALLPITQEQADAENAQWPQVDVRPEGATLNNRCRLCPHEPHSRATHRVLVRQSWIESDWGHYAGLCDSHRRLADDVVALIDALNAEVAERTARSSLIARKDPP